MFQTRWRWNTTISLAVPRYRGGRKVPPQLQRMLADDLMAAVFPDAAACLENIPGDREIPDHPLVNQTVRDCLEEAMDLRRRFPTSSRASIAGELTLVSRDTPEPSPLAHEILNARPYAFLDDAPLEERRTQAVYTRRATERSSSRRSRRPRCRRHRSRARGSASRPARCRRIARRAPDGRLFSTEDRCAIHRARVVSSDRRPRESRGAWSNPNHDCRAGRARLDRRRTAARAPGGPSRFGTLDVGSIRRPRGRLAIGRGSRPSSSCFAGGSSILGPTTAEAIAESLAITDGRGRTPPCSRSNPRAAILRGVVRNERRREPGRTGRAFPLQWCDRRLLARIHRYTLNRLRAEIEPVSPADYMRFLFSWQHVEPSTHLSGIDGLRAAIVAVLDGFELAAGAWERSVLPARMDRYEPAHARYAVSDGRGRVGAFVASAKGGRPMWSAPHRSRCS